MTLPGPSPAPTQAAALTAEMALVEPYARRWRRFTLQRQRARLEAALYQPWPWQQQQQQQASPPPSYPLTWQQQQGPLPSSRPLAWLPPSQEPGSNRRPVASPGSYADQGGASSSVAAPSPPRQQRQLPRHPTSLSPALVPSPAAQSLQASDAAPSPAAQRFQASSAANNVTPPSSSSAASSPSQQFLHGRTSGDAALPAAIIEDNCVVATRGAATGVLFTILFFPERFLVFLGSIGGMLHL